MPTLTTTTTAPLSTSTSATVPALATPLPSGTYVNQPGPSPHYFANVQNNGTTAVTGVVYYLTAQGEAQPAMAISGTAAAGHATFVARTSTSAAAVTVSATYASGEITFLGCDEFLPNAAGHCVFELTAGGATSMPVSAG
jgi:hypothetical protein